MKEQHEEDIMHVNIPSSTMTLINFDLTRIATEDQFVRRPLEVNKSFIT